VSFNRKWTTRKQDTDTLFCSCDLDLDPMTLTYKLDLEIPKMYLNTTNKLSKTRHCRQTDTQTDATKHVTTYLLVHIIVGLSKYSLLVAGTQMLSV